MCSSDGRTTIVRAQTGADPSDPGQASISAAQESAPEHPQLLAAQLVMPLSALSECRLVCAQQMAHARRADTKRSHLTNKCPIAYRFSSVRKERTARDWRRLGFQ